MERNYRVREGEIDLIAARGDVARVLRGEDAREPRRAGARAGQSRRVGRLPQAGEGAAHGADLARSAQRQRRARPAVDVIGIVLSPAGELLRLEHVEGAF